MNTPAKDAVWS